MLWLSRNEDASLNTYPAHQWALLMGLDAPEQGAPSHIRLLSDTGGGRPYRAPGLAMRKATKQEKAANLYVQLAAGFWTKGWVAHLSGAAIAMYLVLLHEQMGEENKSVWIAPRMGQERFDLSDETRRKGLKALVDQNLAAVRKPAGARPAPDIAAHRVRAWVDAMVGRVAYGIGTHQGQPVSVGVADARALADETATDAQCEELRAAVTAYLTHAEGEPRTLAPSNGTRPPLFTYDVLVLLDLQDGVTCRYGNRSPEWSAWRSTRVSRAPRTRRPR
ncbi:hypothetical protein OHB49_45170 (plasmid) [Streptomyces sp. NBC_01717]|uniref:hypothetical protein n=1 Tax=Streptomyces sp. NBC_01717 TaxID=2975918 RepID=UPI002E324E82|nr:hypothetical protein [Streptomyces sp. NBC_01717]